MIVKKKKCKGNYRSGHFKGCGNSVYIFKFGLCRDCFAKFLLSDSDIAKKELNKRVIKAKTEIKSEKKRIFAKRKNDLKGITAWKDDLQKEINWIVRNIDIDYPCISHPEHEKGLRYDAGHYFSVASCSDLRYHLDNIHKQGSWANTNHGGCPEYAIGLKQRYGVEYLNSLEGLRLKCKGIAKERFTIENIRYNFLPKAREIVREMKKGKPYTRIEVNEKMGIYPKECLIKMKK